MPLDDARETHFAGEAGGRSETGDIEGFGRLNTRSPAFADRPDATTCSAGVVSEQPRPTVPACPPILEPGDICRQEVHSRCPPIVNRAKIRAQPALGMYITVLMIPFNVTAATGCVSNGQ